MSVWWPYYKFNPSSFRSLQSYSSRNVLTRNFSDWTCSTVPKSNFVVTWNFSDLMCKTVFGVPLKVLNLWMTEFRACWRGRIHSQFQYCCFQKEKHVYKILFLSVHSHTPFVCEFCLIKQLMQQCCLCDRCTFSRYSAEEWLLWRMLVLQALTCLHAW